MREPIYVIGIPKSGTTWVSRLLADALDSPLGGSRPSEDDKEFASEGWDRPGKFVVRRGHFKLVDNESGPFVPGSHKMAWKLQDNQKIIFVVRDPRDMVVSHAHYWERSLEESVERVVENWQEYNIRFMYFPSLRNMLVIQYEELHGHPEYFLKRMVKHCGLVIDKRILAEVVERQSFEVRKAQANTEFLQRFMRKGVVGDWVNYLNRDQCEKIDRNCSYLMLQLGYIKDRDWWKEVPK